MLQPTQKKVIEILEEHGQVRGIDITTRLDSLGYDSIDTLRLLIKLEDAFNISINNPEIFADFGTVEDLADEMYKRRPWQ